MTTFTYTGKVTGNNIRKKFTINPLEATDYKTSRVEFEGETPWGGISYMTSMDVEGFFAIGSAVTVQVNIDADAT